MNIITQIFVYLLSVGLGYYSIKKSSLFLVTLVGIFLIWPAIRYLKRYKHFKRAVFSVMTIWNVLMSFLSVYVTSQYGDSTFYQLIMLLITTGVFIGSLLMGAAFLYVQRNMLNTRVLLDTVPKEKKPISLKDRYKQIKSFAIDAITNIKKHGMKGIILSMDLEEQKEENAVVFILGKEVELDQQHSERS